MNDFYSGEMYATCRILGKSGNYNDDGENTYRWCQYWEEQSKIRKDGPLATLERNAEDMSNDEIENLVKQCTIAEVNKAQYLDLNLDGKDILEFAYLQACCTLSMNPGDYKFSSSNAIAAAKSMNDGKFNIADIYRNCCKGIYASQLIDPFARKSELMGIINVFRNINRRK
jgi:hypothetical protein